MPMNTTQLAPPILSLFGTASPWQKWYRDNNVLHTTCLTPRWARTAVDGKGRGLTERHQTEPERRECPLREGGGNNWGQDVPSCERPRQEQPAPTGAGVSPPCAEANRSVLQFCPGAPTSHQSVGRTTGHLSQAPGQPVSRQRIAPCDGTLQYNNNNNDDDGDIPNESAETPELAQMLRMQYELSRSTRLKI